MSNFPCRTFKGVAECADFGPASNGEDFVTMTFRVPKDTPAYARIWNLSPQGPGTFDWAVSNMLIRFQHTNAEAY